MGWGGVGWGGVGWGGVGWGGVGWGGVGWGGVGWGQRYILPNTGFLKRTFFDQSQLHEEAALSKVVTGFFMLSTMRKGWRVARNDVLHTACRLLCNPNDEYVDQGKHRSKVCAPLEDVVHRVGDWRNNPYFGSFVITKRLCAETPAQRD